MRPRSGCPSNEIIKANAAVVGPAETKALLDHMRTDYQAVVEELVPGMLSLGDVQRVLQNLLRESVHP